MKRNSIIVYVISTIIIIVLFSLALNLVFKDWGIDGRFNNDYVYVSEFSSLLHQSEDLEHSLGEEILSHIKMIKNFDKWIVVATQESDSINGYYGCCNNDVQYWIVNTSMPIISPSPISISDSIICGTTKESNAGIDRGLIGPMDSLSFRKKITELGIPF